MRFFQNKSFHVKVVDDPVALPPGVNLQALSTPPANPVDYEKIVQTVVAGAIVVIVTYMGSDTIRQVIINSTKRV